jgi:hypothetical protein
MVFDLLLGDYKHILTEVRRINSKFQPVLGGICNVYWGILVQP